MNTIKNDEALQTEKASPDLSIIPKSTANPLYMCSQNVTGIHQKASSASSKLCTTQNEYRQMSLRSFKKEGAVYVQLWMYHTHRISHR